jgi:hypothetical protein
MFGNISTVCILVVILAGITLLINTGTHDTRISADITTAIDQATNNQMAVKNFQEYLRIRTVQPVPDYKNAMKFLKRMAEELGVKFKIIEVS